ncbi:unnamed protein product (macronuclear) [Paramecium tetraurelia]|uniref:RING-type domain-containing protein n=1 Tax=Paramecium tetraurelia TaxID=5888 RepID=A0DN79_PARTE|nr:uncharacterized protein GSPATT00018701001 [Paramecium tetraurelia]CAK84496.1 unnamed protein product [Paramecium tetraurelia]|eukprot:XP_001451893.1 hypothetical protein (macronuclear) [Paramecium tetraurelia strain d4-2]
MLNQQKQEINLPNQQKQIIFNLQVQPSQLLQENRFLESQFRLYFQKDKLWLTSQNLENQTIQAFIINFQKILNEISKRQQLSQTIKLYEMGINANQIFNIEMLLNTKSTQLEDVAKLLQIKLIFIITSLNKQWEFGVINKQILKTVIQMNSSPPNFSFIVGFGLFKQQQQIAPIVTTNFHKLFTPNHPNPLLFQEQRVYTPQNNVQNKPSFQILSNQSSPAGFPDCKDKNQQEEEDSVLTTSQISEYHKEKEKPVQKINMPNSYSIKITSTQCEICSEIYQKTCENQIILPCCQKIVHRECVQKDLTQSVDLFDNKKCYFCSKQFAMSFFKEILGLSKFQEQVKKQIIEKCVDTCFQCNAKFPVLPKQQEKIFAIICQQCQIEICSRCRKKFHGISSDCKNIRQELFRVFQGQPLIVCEFCDLIQTKDEKCDHVTCYQCKMDLCSVCSVDRRPIVSHGNHFHRKGCPHYAIEKGKEEMTQERLRNCELCKSNINGACSIPIDLQTYKKLKGYDFS